MHSDTQRARFFTWIVIVLSLVVGAGFFLWMSGKYRGQAAQKVNVSKTNIMAALPASTLVGYWTFDGSHVVWGDTTSEIKDVNPGTKHHGDASNLSPPSAVPGRTGQALSFNGTSSVVSLGSVSSSVKTVAFWVKPNTTTQPLIDLNGTATVDVSSGTVQGNNFTSPTIYVDGVAMAGVSLAAPTFVSEYPTAFNSVTSPKTAVNAVSINTGDVLIGVAAHESDTGTLAITEDGAASWVSQQTYKTTDYSETSAWSYVATTSETLTVTFTDNSGYFGGNVVRFSGSDGVGASAKNQGASGSPSVNITTTQANSAIVVIVSDWNATGGTQTFTSDGGAGSPTNLTDYPGDSSHYGVAIAYYPNAGAVGSKTVGMSAPTGQKWTIVAVEVKGDIGDIPLDTEWHHVTVTTGTGINASAVNLGKIASSYFGGTLDDVRFYSGALTATEVADLFRSTGAGEVSSSGGEGMMTNGLVGHWTFDGNDIKWSDTSLEIKDVSGNGNHGDAAGSLATTSVVPGKLGQGLSFNGTSDYISAPLDLSSTQTVTVSFWFKANTWVNGEYAFMFNDGGWGFEFIPSEGGIICYAGDMYLRVHANTGPNIKCYDTRPSSGEWHYFAAVFDLGQATPSNELNLYLDGALQSPYYISAIANNTINFGSDSLFIASTNVPDSYLAGSMDDFRIYNRALSASEILNLYTLGK